MSSKKTFKEMGERVCEKVGAAKQSAGYGSGRRNWLLQRIPRAKSNSSVILDETSERRKRME